MQAARDAIATAAISAGSGCGLPQLNQWPAANSYSPNHVSCNMRQVILTVPDDQFAPLMKVVKALPFAIKAKAVAPPKPKNYTPEQQEWIDDFREALNEVELHQQGKINLQTAEEFLAELRAEQTTSAEQ